MKTITIFTILFLIFCYTPRATSQINTVPFDQNIGTYLDDSLSGERPNGKTYYIDTVIYTVSDKAGNKAIANRIVTVKDKKVENAYLESIEIPDYNPNDSTHVLITPSNGSWAEYILNDPYYKHFYLKPGKYLTKINLTASGTQSNRRTLSLLNGNNTHPAALLESQIADIRFELNNASYWIFDRVANLNSVSYNQALAVRGTSSHNILNRILLEKFNNGIVFFGGGDNNTVQNSRIQNMNIYAPDGVAMALTRGHNNETMYAIKNTKIINNEFYNCSDSIQLVRRNRPSDGQLQDANYEGTIIDSNIIYIDNNLYTDGNGNLLETGKNALAENALDFKAGSENVDNPVIVTNNKMWGYRKSDNLAGGARSDFGSAIVVHFGVRNIKIKHNIIFDSAQGIVTGAKDRFAYSIENSEITDNIFYDIGAHPGTNSTYGGVMLWSSSNLVFKRNTVVNARVKSIWGKATIANLNITENVVIDSAPPYNETPSKNKFDYNYYYNTFPSGYALGENDTVFNNPAQAVMINFVFQYDKLTSELKQTTLEGVITTSNSPHYKKAGSTIQSPQVNMIFTDGFE